MAEIIAKIPADSSVFYTRRASPRLAAQVARITGSTENFATGFMGRPEGGDDIPSTRLVALYDREGGCWTINRQTRMTGDSGSVTYNQTEAAEDLCFFDALHYLARFQTTERDLGKQPLEITGTGLSDIRHYTSAAKEAGQAIDNDGEVHPCIGGQILTTGFFSDEAIEIAATTKEKHHPAEPGSGRQMLQIIQNNTALPAVQTETTHTMSDSRLVRNNEIHNLGKVMEHTGYLLRNFEEAIENRFRPQIIEAVAFGLCTAGIAPAVIYTKEKEKPGARRAYEVNYHIKRMQPHIEALPDNAEKSMLQDFSRAARYALCMERAAHHYDTCRRRNKSEKVIRRALPLIDEAAAIIGLDGDGRDHLRADYMAGALVKDQFYQKLSQIWGAYSVGSTLAEKRLNRECATEAQKKSLRYKLVTRIEDLQGETVLMGLTAGRQPA